MPVNIAQLVEECANVFNIIIVTYKDMRIEAERAKMYDTIRQTVEVNSMLMDLGKKEMKRRSVVAMDKLLWREFDKGNPGVIEYLQKVHLFEFCETIKK